MGDDSFNKEINIIDKEECFIINNNLGFNNLGICDIGSGIKTVKNVGFIKEDINNILEDDFSGIVSEYNLSNELFYKETDDMILVLTSPKFNKVKKNNLFLLDNYDDVFDLDFIFILKHYINSEGLLNIYRSVINAQNIALEKLGVNLHENNNFGKLIVSCVNNPNDSIDICLEDIESFISDFYYEILRDNGFSLGILDYIYEYDITLEDLVDTGMMLCVGVDESEERELKEKLYNQLLKSLEDINVVTLLMAAFGVEEKYSNHLVREVDVDDDPAYLYSDEVLGIDIAVQIAGTKALFNFTRYDKAKPGILSKLGPMVDDIIGGLIAGSMSKIFEN